jgi:two-component system CheB/CheR fusion protein
MPVRKSKHTKGILLPLQPETESIAHISHELKSFITSSKAYLQLAQRNIKKSSQDEKSLQYLEKMDVQLTKLNYQISDFFDTVRLQTKTYEIFLEQVSLQQLISTAIEQVKKLYPTHKISCKKFSEYSLLLDKQRIERTLMHLLSNAIKYSPEDSEIFVEVTVNKKFVHIFIKNAGIVISKKESESIFQPFFQSLKLGNQQGLGLGLYFAREIARFHKGDVTLVSSKKGETTFRLSLPQMA